MAGRLFPLAFGCQWTHDDRVERFIDRVFQMLDFVACSKDVTKSTVNLLSGGGNYILTSS